MSDRAEPLSSEPEYVEQPDGRMVAGPALSSVKPKPKRERTGGWKAAPAALIAGLLGIGGGWFARSASPSGPASFHDVVTQRLYEGCRPTFQYAVGTEARVEDWTRANSSIRANYESYPDAENIRLEITELPADSPVRDADVEPAPTHITIATVERCLP